MGVTELTGVKRVLFFSDKGTSGKIKLTASYIRIFNDLLKIHPG